MLSAAVIDQVVTRASLAPSVHNTQPTRWMITDTGVDVYCDTRLILPHADPDGRGAALSCGAAIEAAVLALSANGIGADVKDLWHLGHDGADHLRLIARIDLTGKGAEDGLHSQLERRFTWRGLFDDTPVALFGWTRPDAVLVTDEQGRAFLADINDRASLKIMQSRPFRRELRSWMRLRPDHPRAPHDGMSLAALRMTPAEGRGAGLALGPLWPLLHLLGRTKTLTAEAEATKSAALIALFHRPAGESPIESGRAYLRMCLEAASLGMAGWPMAAISDDPTTRADTCARFGIGADRRLVQAIRFGRAGGAAPPRARRPLSEVIL
ncbi:hypothetical protein [Octadecabacter sp. R77987]|uniref:hypothetical protein n=1 Tax=Octadecabacter sp. R77987 TaxID=3093874 RepID=UPI0036701FC1